jgi:hypothetical protein
MNQKSGEGQNPKVVDKKSEKKKALRKISVRP